MTGTTEHEVTSHGSARHVSESRARTAEACNALLLELAAPVVELVAHVPGHLAGAFASVSANHWVDEPSGHVTCWRVRPATSDDVAARLNMLGCVGDRGEPCSCPVAIYLSRHGYNVQVCGTAFVVFDVCIVTARGMPPPAVDSFIRLFDAGHYLELRA